MAHIFTIILRDTYTDGAGKFIDTVQVMCEEGDYEGVCVIVEMPSKDGGITHEEIVAEFVSQGFDMRTVEIDG